jgi:nucleosome assembly protein 1-like 1
MLQNVTGTKINWKPNKSLTHRTISKKQRKKGGKNAGQVRTVQKTEKAESFFHFFTPPKMPELGDVVDEEEADAMEEHFDHDYEVACAVRGSLIPNAVHWFTGEAVEDMMYGDDDMVEEEGEDGEDVDGEVDGAGNGGFVFNPNGAGNNPFPPPAPGNGENPECQQN